MAATGNVTESKAISFAFMRWNGNADREACELVQGYPANAYFLARSCRNTEGQSIPRNEFPQSSKGGRPRLPIVLWYSRHWKGLAGFRRGQFAYFFLGLINGLHFGSDAFCSFICP